MAGIYVHIPFCKQKCHYCSFHFSTSFEKYRERMLSCLTKEIEVESDLFKQQEIATVYIGGGTPSILTKKELEELLFSIRTNFQLSNSVEITLEANPDDISISSAKTWLELGVNRLSIGVQSFQEKDLKTMNRAHSADEAVNAIFAIKEAGFTNYSVDLMFALPDLTAENWRKNLQQLLAFKVPHISCYNLTIEEQSALIKMIQQGKIKALNENASAEQFELLMETLSSAGYLQYEISNFCLPGMHSQHNSAYWNQQEYLGIGPSAHSYINGKRYHNVAHNIKYMDGVEQNQVIKEEEILTPENKFNEYIMTRLRCSEGISIPDINNLFPDFYKEIHQTISSLEKKGHLKITKNAIQLTHTGKFFADQISMELFV